MKCPLQTKTLPRIHSPLETDGLSYSEVQNPNLTLQPSPLADIVWAGQGAQETERGWSLPLTSLVLGSNHLKY